MKISMRVAILSLFVLAILGASPAAAKFSHFSIGPHLAWSNNVESDETSIAYGFATRLKLLEAFAAELAIDYQKEDFDHGEITTIPVQVSGLLYLMPALHVTAGVGWYNVDASFDAVGTVLEEFDDSASDAGFHLGAGLDMQLNPRSSFTAEIRYIFLGYELESAANIVQDVDANFYTISAGFQFFLW